MLKKNLHIISLFLFLFSQLIVFGQELSTLTIVISDVQIDPNGDILIIGENGELVELPGGEDTVITDSNGQVWAVDEQGNVSNQGSQAEGGASTPENTNGVNSNGQATAISAKGVIVTFTKASDSKYGFDSYESSYSATKDLYKKLGNDYYIPYKAVAKNDTETIVANLAITDSKIKPQDLIFKTKEGVAITKIDSTATSYTLQLKGVFDDAEVETQALIKQNAKYEVAGAFIQYQATPKNVNVVLVNTANTNTDKIKEELQNIYKQAMVNFTITEINDFKDDLETLTPNGTIQSGESGFAAQYTEQQRQINAKLKQHSRYKEDAYYLIVTNKQPTSTAERGLMPLGRQFGYIYTANCNTTNCIEKTVAHELGHGAFQLKHPFSSHSYQYPEKATNWLLDYKEGTKLPFVHWQAIHNPKLRIGIFDSDKEGQHESHEYYAGYNVVPGNFSQHLPQDYKRDNILFISPTEKLITLPKSVLDVTFTSKGALLGFTVNENGKKERYIGAVRSVDTPQENFAGYLKKFSNQSTASWEDRVYQDKLSKKLSKTNPVDVFVGKLNSSPCGINLYKTTISNKTSGNWNSGGDRESISKKDFTNGLTPINTNPITSSAACDFCDKGKEFYVLHTKSISDENILRVVRDISKLICDPEADTSFFEEFSEKGYNNLYEWQKTFYDEGLWKDDLEAYDAFYNAYFKYVELYKTNKSVIKNLSLYDREQILKSTYQFSHNQLKLLTAKERAGMLQSILNGHVGGYWTGGNYNVEALVLNIIKTVNDQKETEQTKKFLDYLVDGDYKVGDDLLYKQLVDKVNDSFFGTDANRLTLINELTELSLKAKGINLKEGLTLTTNQDYESLLSEAQCKGDFYWEVTNESFLWLFNVVNDKSKLEFDFINNQKNIRLRQFCTNWKTESHGNYGGTTTCTDWKIKGEFDPFELVALNIINDLTFTKQSGACENNGAVVCGKVMLVPAMFVDYLDRKRSNTQIQNGVFNTLTVASFYFSGSTIIGARGALTLKTFPAYADLFVTMANPYFSDDTLFVAHVTSLLQNNFGTSEAKAKETAKLLQTLWTIGSIPLTLDTATSIPNAQKHIEAIVTYKALVRKFGSVEEAKKVIANSPELAEKVVKGFNEAENNLRISSQASKILDDEIANKTKKLDDILGTIGSSSLVNLKNSLIDRLPNGSELKEIIKKLNAEDNESLIKKIFDLNENRLNDFNKIVTSEIGVDELDNLFSAWGVLIRKSPQIAKIPESSKILADIAPRFSYGGASKFEGLHKLFNEGSQVQSKQKLINHLKEANKYFEDVLPIEFSAIKKGDVKITIIDVKITIIDEKGKGAEVGRYVDGILQKKKILSEADGASIVKKADNPDDDILQKDNQVGFRKLTNTEGNTKFGRSFINSLEGFSDDIASLASKQGLSVDEFKTLQQKRYDVMTSLEKTKIDAIRNAIPLPDGNTILQKAIPKTDIPKYLRDTNPYYQVGGFITTAKDAKHLSTFEDIFYGMRLDYEGTAFNLSDGSFGIIRYKTLTPKAQVPRITGPQDKFPFTGNGFTSGNSGKLGVPEWKTPYNTPVDGAELWEVTSDGTETLRAVFNSNQNKFIEVQ